MFLAVAVLLEARQPEHAPLQPEHDARGPPSDTTPPRLVPPPGAPISPRGHQFRLVAPPAAPATVATLEPGDWNRLEWLRGRGAQQQQVLREEAEPPSEGATTPRWLEWLRGRGIYPPSEGIWSESRPWLKSKPWKESKPWLDGKPWLAEANTTEQIPRRQRRGPPVHGEEHSADRLHATPPHSLESHPGVLWGVAAARLLSTQEGALRDGPREGMALDAKGRRVRKRVRTILARHPTGEEARGRVPLGAAERSVDRVELVVVHPPAHPAAQAELLDGGAGRLGDCAADQSA